MLVATPLRIATPRHSTTQKMEPQTSYSETEPSRSDIDALDGPLVIEFGTSWCGYCIAAQPVIRSALSGHPHLRHIRIADGRGRPLGRSFGVKLWPTLIFLRQGKELGRVVRPTATNEIERMLAQLDPAA